MMRKSITIVCILSVCLLCGCSNTNVNVSPTSQQMTSEMITEASATPANADNADTVLTNVLLCYKGHFKDTEHITEGDYDLTKCTVKGELQEPHTIYTISNDGSFCYENAYDYCADDVKCQFSKEKVQEFFYALNACNLLNYEIYHSNSDGVMVTKYPEYYVYDTASDKAYVLSEDDYMTILAKADELRTIADLNTERVD